MRKIIRSLCRLARGKAAPSTGVDLIRNHRLAFISAHNQVRLFYAMMLYFVSEALRSAPEWKTMATLEYAWALRWGKYLPQVWVMTIVIGLLFVSAVLAMLKPESRFFRCLAFLALLFYGSYICSFGKISHGQHAWVYIAFCFIFLPSRPFEQLLSSRTERQTYLTCFTFAQFTFLCIYTSSGFVKLLNGLFQQRMGLPNLFSQNGFAYLIADTIKTNKMTGALGPWLIDHTVISGPLLFFGALLEFVAVAAILRPEIHRLWGVLLASFHLVTILTLQVWYLEHVFPAIILLIMSPFACVKAHASLKERLTMLPGINLLLRLIRMAAKERPLGDALTGGH